MSARRERVRLAVDGVTVEVTRHDTGVLPVVPGGTWVTTVTTLTARVAAVEQILRGDSGLGLLVAVDANSVGHGLSGTESPA